MTFIFSGRSTKKLESASNKVTSLSSSSTDTQYPSAKCVYDELDAKQDVLTAGNSISITSGSGGFDYENPTTTSTNINFSKIIYDGSKYIGVGTLETIATSTDGSTWTTVNTVNNGKTLKDIAYGNNKYVAVGYNGVFYTSSDGTTWTKSIVQGKYGEEGEEEDVNVYWYCVAFGNNTFVACGYYDGNTYAIADNGSSWSSSNVSLISSDFQGISCLIYDGTQFVVADGYGSFGTSSGGSTWSFYDSTSSIGCNYMVYNSGLYTTVDGYEVAVSSDLQNWDRTYGELVPDIKGMFYTNGTYIMVCAELIVTTTDIAGFVDELYTDYSFNESGGNTYDTYEMSTENDALWATQCGSKIFVFCENGEVLLYENTQGGLIISCVVDSSLSNSSTNPVQNSAVYQALSGKAASSHTHSQYQSTSNLVTSVSSNSTDSQYPSAKLFYDTVGNIESLLSLV